MSRTLLNPIQKRIVDLVNESPGIKMQDMTRELHLSYACVRHHADTLEARGQVLSSIERRGLRVAKRYYPPGPRRRLTALDLMPRPDK